MNISFAATLDLYLFPWRNEDGSLQGCDELARTQAAEVLRMNPNHLMDSWAKTFTYKDQSQQDKIVNAARKAGLK